jgi:hypothetical protein
MRSAQLGDLAHQKASDSLALFAKDVMSHAANSAVAGHTG